MIGEPSQPEIISWTPGNFCLKRQPNRGLRLSRQADANHGFPTSAWPQRPHNRLTQPTFGTILLWPARCALPLPFPANVT